MFMKHLLENLLYILVVQEQFFITRGMLIYATLVRKVKLLIVKEGMSMEIVGKPIVVHLGLLCMRV